MKCYYIKVSICYQESGNKTTKYCELCRPNYWAISMFVWKQRPLFPYGCTVDVGWLASALKTAHNKKVSKP